MIKIIAVGKMKNKALAELCADYCARIKRFCKIETTELKDAGVESEADKIIESLKNFKGRVYAMSQEGRLCASEEFAKMLESDLQRGGSAFIIGSAYGLAERAKARADALMSLSPMTFTHEFARAILAEQIYRAKTITHNTGYHH